MKRPKKKEKCFAIDLPPTLKPSNPDFEGFKLPLCCLVTPGYIDDNRDNN